MSMSDLQDQAKRTMSAPRSLNDLQRWMQAVIMHPDGIDAGIASSTASAIIDVSAADIERVILPSQALGSAERLQVYGRAYYSRLIECLIAQFPAVHHAIGDEAFIGLAYGYLIQHPSRSYTLGSLGASFDSYLQATRPPRSDAAESAGPEFADFLIDLAQLERTYNEVFDGPGPEQTRSLQTTDIEGLSAEEFGNCRLKLHACVRLLELRFPVHEFASAVRKQIEPSAPIARPVFLVVTRRDYIVRRIEITRTQFELLSAMARHATLGEALAEACTGPDVDPERIVTDLRRWFQEWTAAPLFAQLDREPHFVARRSPS